VSAPAVTDAELAERFGPVLEDIRAGALDREAERRLPYDEVELLRAVGFGRLRLPQEHGGFGATIPQLVRLLVALGAADSNLPQLLRGHLGFVETRLVHPDAEVRDRWLRRIAGGVLVGNAQSETGSRSFWENTTTITEDGGRWRLSGRKFYSTGSLFADWIHTTATLDAERSATILVPTSAPGVTRIDDWDGFGQRLTGSGTTLFDAVPVHLEDVEIYDNGRPPGGYLTAFFQLVHLATLAGIGRAAVRDIAAFVRQRERNLANPAYPRPALDPAVQQVVGRLAGAAFAAEATTLAAAEAVQRAHAAELEGRATPELVDGADVAVFGAQHQVIDLVLGIATDVFEVGGASAVTSRFRLDRHWRNARTLASHNPVVHRDQVVGDHLLNGTSPSAVFERTWADVHQAAGSRR
jgi:alkylation response protein AidB-like acyl-CoA dehydrogenase